MAGEEASPEIVHLGRYKVFVSSTYLDNKKRRELVQDAITMADMVWHGMEIFTASTRPTVEECLRCAREADVLVGIIAWRYGWVPEDSEISITEMEYDAAKERLMFVLDPSLSVNPEKDFDEEPDRWDKQKKLAAFKKRISADQMPAQLEGRAIQVLAARERRSLVSRAHFPVDQRRHDDPTAALRKPPGELRLGRDALHKARNHLRRLVRVRESHNVGSGPRRLGR